jgi:hypothetical protein
VYLADFLWLLYFIFVAYLIRNHFLFNVGPLVYQATIYYFIAFFFLFSNIKCPFG